MSRKLDSHEYKLMLASPGLPKAVTADWATEFWRARLSPLVATHLGLDSTKVAALERGFDETVERSVGFKDTPDCRLTRAGYSFRERVIAAPGPGGGSSCEITLKLRLDDPATVSATPLEGRDAGARTKFEEDVSAAPSATARPPIATRSRFSLSTTQTVPLAERPATLAELEALYPTLDVNLAGTGGAAPDQRLVAGAPIDEIVFEGAKAELASGRKAKFALTLWRIAGADPIGELSFKVTASDDAEDKDAAAQARSLFLAIIGGLGDALDDRQGGKTAFGLPPGCGGDA